MSKRSKLRKRQLHERQQHKLELQKSRKRQLESDELMDSDDSDEFDDIDDTESLLDDEEVPEKLSKDLHDEVVAHGVGPTTFRELEDARTAEKKASLIRDISWDTTDLVRNIIHSPLLDGRKKGDLIKKVGSDFSLMVQGIMDTPGEMLKESNEILEIEAVLAYDARKMGLIEKATEYIRKKVLTSEALNALEDKSFALIKEKDGKTIREYPINNKAHVRAALAEVALQMKSGGEGAVDAQIALPKIREAARDMSIEVSMDKEKNAIIVQKDANGDWRWVGWVSNNFIDKSQDILTEKAHLEYVDWLQKNMEHAPVFTSLHAPGTARKHPVDFVGYENGFLVMSGKLEDEEAAGLMRIQKEHDLGMSHTGWGIRSEEDPRQIVMYRLYEVTDLPIELADNPFTQITTFSKEDPKMDKQAQIEYLGKLLGDEKKAEEALSMKTAMKQKALQDEGVEQKEKPSESNKDEKQKAPKTIKGAPVINMEEVMKAVSKEFDMDGLSEAFGELLEAQDKIPLLESIVKQQQEKIVALGDNQEEALADKISPPNTGRFAWQKTARQSQSNQNEVTGDDLKKLKETTPGPKGPEDDEWLSEVTKTDPVESVSV
ncbi:MAG: hypothetical protein QGM50_02400 [Anaerolineae bacterium]|nr:hypothetical protein [Anaerolineae bacterium]